ncbi:terminase small subunit [Psychrobacillus lasiicapitis]|uniref:Terminase small subunit n=2 Tax=Psychrobacillus lasiicapitis TaxID=1636719 RepID=A0A544TAP3_9BACI|nr:terminase small subunit [Psychrobacillus lasiicapitis]
MPLIEQKLTMKQQAFADNYIELGNATEAYLKAYPNVKKEATARANGSRLLTNANVSAYIESRMEELKSERVADQQEILEYLTSIMRGEQQEQTLRGMGEGYQSIDDIDVSAKDRIKAAEMLGKRYAMWTEKQQIDGLVPVTIVNDLDD